MITGRLAIDFDGTLCTKMPKPPMKWGRMNGEQRKGWKQLLLKEYHGARILLNPRELGFRGGWTVISARKEEPSVRAVSEAWLQSNFRNQWGGLILLDAPRSIKAVVAFKAQALLRCGASFFIEDNLAVVKGLWGAPELTSVRVAHFCEASKHLVFKDGSSVAISF